MKGSIDMLSLNEIIHQEFCDHDDFWNYYNENFRFPLGNAEESKEFIKNYFNAGAKLSVCKWAQLCGESQNLDHRAIHTKNVFFIGSFIQRMIDEKLSVVLNQEQYPFSYLWYLTCLGHDFGYEYEDREIISYPQIKIPSMLYLQMDRKLIEMQKCKIDRFDCYKENKVQMNFPRIRFQYNNKRIDYRKIKCEDSSDAKIRDIILRARMIANGEDICVEFTNNSYVKGKWYTNELIEKYFRYRIERYNVMDHGIVGGDKLFDCLISNYIEEMKRTGLQGEDIDFYNDRNIYFSKDLLYIYAYVANCVSVHNIFRCGEEKENIEKYKKYELNELLPDNYKMISYANNPLLFVLSIADTVEPTKRFKNVNELDVLENVRMGFDAEDKEIIICIDKSLAETDEGKKYIRDIEELDKWCKIHGKVVID